MKSSSIYNQIKVIVVGGLNTDIIASGVKRFLNKGELIIGGNLVISAGGKSRNIAQMISFFLGKNKTAMIGRTSKDPFGFWKVPLDALEKAGVNTNFVKIIDFEKTKKYPGVALIPVNTKGENQIYVLPGINNDFCSEDIDDAEPIFEVAKKNSGILALSLELPIETAIHSIKKASFYGLKIILDPGGIDKEMDYEKLLNQNIVLIKPNEHEAEIITGIKVIDFKTAKKAARIIFKKGIPNVFITHGENGGYLFTKEIEKHIPVPFLTISGERDETGCGDQVTAILCAELAEGKDIYKASCDAILAGTLQFYKAGVNPVLPEELNRYEKESKYFEKNL